MTDKEVKDCEYVAIKMVTGIKSSVIDELLSKGVISSHRDMVPDNINEIIKKAESLSMPSNVNKSLKDVCEKLDKCRYAAEDYINKAEVNGIRVISVEDSRYPFAWRLLNGMPKVIFAKGNTDLLMDTFTSGAASIVGSRYPGRYSSYATEQFSRTLVDHGVIVVSGLALGIDGVAHKTSLLSGGKTIAVTPGGPDIIYPYQHKELYSDLYSNGLVISEMPPGQGIIKQYFPARNRLIAALSDVCLIMEAGKYSGTLHTASYAVNQGKDVFVLPNGIYYENCIGGLALIRDGAEILIDCDTVLERIKENVIMRVRDYGNYYPELLMRDGDMSRPEVDVVGKMNSAPGTLSTDEWKQVIKLFIEEKPRNFDELSSLITLDVSRLMAYLTELELNSEIATERDRYVLTIQKT